MKSYLPTSAPLTRISWIGFVFALLLTGGTVDAEQTPLDDLLAIVPKTVDRYPADEIRIWLVQHFYVVMLFRVLVVAETCLSRQTSFLLD